MKLRIGLSITLLSALPVSIAYAETPVAQDSEQVCESRINAFKSSLETVIATEEKNANTTDGRQDIDAAKTELARINNLPARLTACEKQRQIPALSNGGAFKTKPENAVKDGNTSPK